MYSAEPTASGTATTTATLAISTVPVMIAAMPNLPPSGFQSCAVRNDSPALCSAFHARYPRNVPTRTMTTSTSAPPRSAPRKVLSAGPALDLTGRRT